MQTVTKKCKLPTATYSDLIEMKETLNLAEELQLPCNQLSEAKNVKELLQTSVDQVSYIQVLAQSIC